MNPILLVTRIADALESIARSLASKADRPGLREALATIALTRFEDHVGYRDGCECLACHARRTMEGM
jgi:hypothetical protein